MKPGIPKFETSLSLRKNWLLAGYDLVYTGKGALLPGNISEITSRILREVLPQFPSETSPNSLLNLKGRTPSDVLIPTIPGTGDHELLQLIGDVASTGEEDEQIWEPFSISAVTRFQEFIGFEKAKYSLETNRSKSTPDDIPLHMIADAITVRLRSFRFGFEHFQPTTHKYFFGYTPAVQEVFLLDMTAEEVQFQLRVDGSSRSVKNPLLEIPQLSSALRAIGCLWEKDLVVDFQQKLSSYM